MATKLNRNQYFCWNFFLYPEQKLSSQKVTKMISERGLSFIWTLKKEKWSTKKIFFFSRGQYLQTD